MNIIIFLFLSVCFGTGITTAADKTTYVGGVVEYHQPKVPIFDAIDLALEAYEHYMDEAKQKFVDILVFPEATINYHPDAAIIIPTAEANENPCNNDSKNFSKILTKLSCAAKKNKLYVVVNLAERAKFCDEKATENCTEEADLIFNTNIILDRQGAIISRYRKINLYIEPGFTPSRTKDLGVFSTDFGVTFGHFICFDIMFQQPAVQIVEKEKVRNIVYPTMWFSILPFYPATAIQETWANIHNVNLLAAGANNIKKGNTGTGIYSGKKGIQVGRIFGEEQSQLFVFELPKDPDAEIEPETSPNPREVLKPDPETMDSLHLYQDDLTLYHSKELDDADYQNITLFDHDMICEFFITIEKKSPKENKFSYTYRAVAFNGVKQLTQTTTAGAANCGIVACLNGSLASCGLRFPKYSTLHPTIELSKITIQATIIKPAINKAVEAMDSTYGPITLDTSIMAMDIEDYEYSVKDHSSDPTKQIVTLKLKKPQTELLTFGIMGRVFKRDGLPASAGIQASGYPLTVAAAFLLQNFNILRNV